MVSTSRGLGRLFGLVGLATFALVSEGVRPATSPRMATKGAPTLTDPHPVPLLATSATSADGTRPAAGGAIGYCEVGQTANGVPVALMFAPNTSRAYVQRVMQGFSRTYVGSRDDASLQYYVPYNRWTVTAQGAVNPRGNAWVLFSKVPDGTAIPASGSFGAGPSSLFAAMSAKFPSGVDWTSPLDRGMWPWSDRSGLRFGVVGDDGQPMSLGAHGVVGVRGDIRIGAKALDGQGGLLAYCYYPEFGEMVLDTSENWANPADDYRFLRNVVAHEAGHGIGLGHVSPCIGTKLMEPYVYTGYDTVQHDDVLGANDLYADRMEGWNSNDIPQHAVDLGVLPMGTQSLGLPLSLSTPGDGDWFRFTPQTDARVVVFVDPVGETYYVGNQSDAGCGASASYVNSLLAKDLQIWLYDSSGTNVLASATENPRGVAETLVYDVRAGVQYTFQISGSADAEVQMYRAAVYVVPQPYVSGYVELRDMVQDHYGLPLTFEIWDSNGTLVESHTLDAVASTFGSSDGQVLFEFETSLEGAYDLTCRGGTWLRKRLKNVTLPSREHFLPLVNGDVNGDNTINIADFLMLRSHFGSSHPQADLNKDGSVGIADFLILRRGFGLSGD
ncbi:MAG: matrixin family metalloprotease [Fimbriimonadaceae bacterium]|nr:matrixin family metalloprotease [Fimbriimonadaceae bacterium]